MGKAEWKKWDFKWRRNVVRVSQERKWGGRLFQIVGAAERKPRAPNEMLQRVTDSRVLHGVCHWTRLAKYGGLPVCIALWVIVAILNLIRSWTGNQCSLLKVAKWEPGVRLPATTRAKVFWVRCRREMYFAGMPYRTDSLHSPAERWQGQQRFIRVVELSWVSRV